MRFHFHPGENPIKKPVRLLCCITLILLAGCAAEQIQAPAPSSTPAPPSPTPSKTNFWRIVTSTITPTPTITPVPPIGYSQQCIDLLPEIPDSAETNGIVVFRRKPDIFILDIATQQTIQLSSIEEFVSEFAVSPDRKHLAIQYHLKDAEGNFTNRMELVITDASGQRLKTIPWRNDWDYSLLRWMDNQHLLLNVNTNFEEYFSGWKFDPFTETQQGIKLQNTAPGWDEFFEASFISPTAYWPGRPAVLINPKYELSLYPHINEDEPGYFTYHLWHITKQQFVVSLDTVVNLYLGAPHYPEPNWSSDGSKFTLGGLIWNDEKEKFDSELFVITNDGQVNQMTNLAEFDHQAIATAPSWSPDERFIAFYLITDEEWETSLAILDTKTEKLTDYCITVDLWGQGGFPQSPAPLWSPDSKQLLLVDNLYSDSEPKRVILIDPEQGFATVIAEDADVIGWMAAQEE